jgi:hypothetical protein
VLLVVSMFLTLGENAQKVPMRRRIAWLGIPKVHILKSLSFKLHVTLSNFWSKSQPQNYNHFWHIQEE